MKEIQLTRGKVTIVDDEDFERLNQHKWWANKGNEKRPYWYALRQYRDPSKGPNHGKRVLVLMHREVINAPKEVFVDHINGDRLDNRKQNLRLCTNAQNLQNQKRYKPGYKGIYRNKDGRWAVMIQANGVYHYLGRYKSERTAAKEYDKIAKLLHGEFANLNFPEKKS